MLSGDNDAKLHVKNRCPEAFRRVLSCVDANTPIEYYAPFSGACDMGNVLICLASISGCLSLVIANEPGVKAGALAMGSIRLIQRALVVALRQRLPTVYLLQTAGLNLQEDANSFVEIGKIFHSMANNTAAGIPSVALVYGTATAGGAYFVGLTDYAIFINAQSQVFLAGPELVFHAIGERNTADVLGGVAVHEANGLADVCVATECEAVMALHVYMDTLIWPKFEGGIAHKNTRWLEWIDSGNKPVGGLVLALLDEGAKIYKPGYGANMFCCFGSVGDHALGVIANNGPIDVAAAHKTCQFIDRCVHINVPLLFLMNTTGFQVGRDCERAGIIVAGSRLIQHMSNAKLPKITLQIGSGYGAGYYAMCGRSFSPDVLLSWPSARVDVMGAEVVANLMLSIKSRSYRRQGKTFTAAAKQKCYDAFYQRYNARSDSLAISSKSFDDGIIAPEDTPRVLAFWLAVFAHAKRVAIRAHRFGLSRV